MILHSCSKCGYMTNWSGKYWISGSNNYWVSGALGTDNKIQGRVCALCVYNEQKLKYPEVVIDFDEF